MTVLKVRYERRYSPIRAITISLSLYFSLCLSLHCASGFFKALILGKLGHSFYTSIVFCLIISFSRSRITIGRIVERQNFRIAVVVARLWEKFLPIGLIKIGERANANASAR